MIFKKYEINLLKDRILNQEFVIYIVARSISNEDCVNLMKFSVNDEFSTTIAEEILEELKTELEPIFQDAFENLHTSNFEEYEKSTVSQTILFKLVKNVDISLYSRCKRKKIKLYFFLQILLKRCID